MKPTQALKKNPSLHILHTNKALVSNDNNLVELQGLYEYKQTFPVKW